MNELFQNIGGQIVPRDVCARKHSGNEQSEAAFHHIAPYLTESQREVFRAIRCSGALGATVDELSQRLQTTPNAISGRVTELRMQNRIKKNGTRKTKSGCSASVWIAE